MTLTRRAALLSGAAAPALALAAPRASRARIGRNDARLLELERRLEPLRAWVDDMDRPEAADAQEERWCDAVYDLYGRIAETPADSVVGLAVKVRQFRYNLDGGDEAMELALDEHHQWHLQAVVRDIERLAGEAT